MEKNNFQKIFLLEIGKLYQFTPSAGYALYTTREHLLKMNDNRLKFLIALDYKNIPFLVVSNEPHPVYWSKYEQTIVNIVLSDKIFYFRMKNESFKEARIKKY